MLGLGGSVLLFAEEPKPGSADAPAGEAAAPAEQASGDAPTKGKKLRLTKPWKEMSSLTDEQKTQIAAIHRKAVEEIKEIQQRERDEIMALLKEEQKTELQAITDKAAVERKTKKRAGGAKKQESAPADTAEQAG